MSFVVVVVVVVVVHLLQALLVCFVLIEDLVAGQAGHHLLQEPKMICRILCVKKNLDSQS